MGRADQDPDRIPFHHLLHLAFDVVVAGDRMTGHSRAGRLPRSAVTGVRRGR